MIYDLSVPVADGTDWYNEAGSPPVSLREIGSLPPKGRRVALSEVWEQ